AVRAVVVHDQQVGAGHRGPDPPGQRLQVFPLVIRGHDDGHAPRSPGDLVASQSLPAFPRLPPRALRDCGPCRLPVGQHRSPAAPDGNSEIYPDVAVARARAAWWRGPPGVPGGAGGGPGLALRTGARPAGRELVPRCLLDARALPGANPPPSQGGWPARRAAPGVGSAELLALAQPGGRPGPPRQLARCWTAATYRPAPRCQPPPGRAGWLTTVAVQPGPPRPLGDNMNWFPQRVRAS